MMLKWTLKANIKSAWILEITFQKPRSACFVRRKNVVCKKIAFCGFSGAQPDENNFSSLSKVMSSSFTAKPSQPTLCRRRSSSGRHADHVTRRGKLTTHVISLVMHSRSFAVFTAWNWLNFSSHSQECKCTPQLDECAVLQRHKNEDQHPGPGIQQQWQGMSEPVIPLQVCLHF